MQRLLARVHELAESWWDPGRRLLVVAGRPSPLATACWADGLLRRGAAGDGERGEVALRGVLEDGTAPAAQEVVLAAVLALAVHDHELPAVLGTDVRAAVVALLDGLSDCPGRTSHEVLRAWVELEVGRWTADADLLAVGAGRARGVAGRSGTDGHVTEHVGPSATGLTLLGLSLWADRPPVPDLAPLGRALRDEVWHDLLAVWHPGLLTLVPPFSVAAGMDLRTHVGITALWLAWLVDGTLPLPPLGGDATPARAEDLPLALQVAALAGAGPDVRALAPLVRAQPARQGTWFDRVGHRVWTGWTGGALAVGAEWDEGDDDARPDAVTAAAVWRAAHGANAWLRLAPSAGPARARVEHERGTVRLVHGTRHGPLHLSVGGAAPTVPAGTAVDVLVHGGRTWRLEGVDRLEPMARGAAAGGPDELGATGVWRLAARGDGVVVSTTV